MAPLLVKTVVVLVAPCSDISLAVPVRLTMPLARLVQSRCDRRVAPWAPAMVTVPAVVMVEESVPKMLPLVHVRLLKTKLSEPVSVPPVRVTVPVLVLVAPVSKVVVPPENVTAASKSRFVPALKVLVPPENSSDPPMPAIAALPVKPWVPAENWSVAPLPTLIVLPLVYVLVALNTSVPELTATTPPERLLKAAVIELDAGEPTSLVIVP